MGNGQQPIHASSRLVKRYLITGASRGIGRAISARLAGPNVTLLLHGRDVAALDETCQLVELTGVHVEKLVFDLATTAGVEALIREVGQKPLDLLVNNAGIAVVKPFAEVTRVELEQTLAVNVTAPILLTQHFAHRMSPGSCIVNILSIAAKTAFPNWSIYSASKFALDGFSSAVREELRTHGVRVVNIYPAATDTEIWNAVEGEWPRNQMMPSASVADAVAFAISQPEAIAIENITLSNTSGSL